MIKRQAGDRRCKESGPPTGCAERRSMAERRRISISDASLDEFEMLMSALGFRRKSSVHDKA